MPPRNCCKSGSVYLKKYNSDGEFQWEWGPTEAQQRTTGTLYTFAADRTTSYVYAKSPLHIFSISPSDGSFISLNQMPSWVGSPSPTSTVASYMAFGGVHCFSEYSDDDPPGNSSSGDIGPFDSLRVDGAHTYLGAAGFPETGDFIVEPGATPQFDVGPLGSGSLRPLDSTRRMVVTTSGTIVCYVPPDVPILQTGAGSATLEAIPSVSGTFKLLAIGAFETTASLPYNATASDVQAALNSLPSISDAVCTGGPLPGTAIAMTYESSQPFGDVFRALSELTISSFAEVDLSGTILQSSGTKQYPPDYILMSIDNADNVYVSEFGTLDYHVSKLAASDLSEVWRTKVLDLITMTSAVDNFPSPMVMEIDADSDGCNVATSLTNDGGTQFNVVELDSSGNKTTRLRKMDYCSVIKSADSDYAVQGYDSYDLIDDGIKGALDDESIYVSGGFRGNGTILDYRDDRVLVRCEARGPTSMVAYNDLSADELNFHYGPPDAWRITGGTYKLQFNYDSFSVDLETGDISTSANAATIKTAIEAITEIGSASGCVTVTLAGSDGYKSTVQVTIVKSLCHSASDLKAGLKSPGTPGGLPSNNGEDSVLNQSNVAVTANRAIVLYDESGSEQWDRAFGKYQAYSPHATLTDAGLVTEYAYPSGGWVEDGTRDVYCWTGHGLKASTLNGAPGSGESSTAPVTRLFT